MVAIYMPKDLMVAIYIRSSRPSPRSDSAAILASSRPPPGGKRRFNWPCWSEIKLACATRPLHGRSGGVCQRYIAGSRQGISVGSLVGIR